MTNGSIAQDVSGDKKTSTYNFLIAQNILTKFNLHLKNEEILKILREKNDIYYCILRAPTENIFNQMIFSQIKSYELFIQKRMLDYLIKTAPSLNDMEAKEGLEPQLPEVYRDLQTEFQTLQKNLLELDNELLKLVSRTNSYIHKVIVQRATLGVLYDRRISPELEETSSMLEHQSKELRHKILGVRQEWNLFAKRICKTLSELGGYYIEEDTDLSQRAEIDFFRDLGG